jgi:hypothetical protein
MTKDRESNLGLFYLNDESAVESVIVALKTTDLEITSICLRKWYYESFRRNGLLDADLVAL